MKHFFTVFCFLMLASGRIFAQQQHFIYLQTDNNQPFYVQLKNKNYSSSSFGYAILPKLENGNYRIKIGFAKSDLPEQDYVLKVNDNDQGYLIKNFGEKGSGIFNLQTMAIQYSGEVGRQLDAAANAQREAERQKIILQQRKDSTEKADAAAAEQKRIDNEAKMAAAAAKQKENAIALEKQRVQDSLKADNEAKLAAAKQKKDAAVLANQQRVDSIKAINASKIAAARQKAQAKHEADSIAKANTPKVETLAQKKARLATEAAVKKEAEATLAQHITDSITAAEQAKAAAKEQQRINDSIAVKQKAEKLAEQEAKRKADEIAAEIKAIADEQQRKNDSLALAEKNRVAAEQATALASKKDSNLLVANTNPDNPASKNVNATIVYEPKVLNRVATDSGTILTYKIPSNKGWDTVTAFIKAPPTEKKEPSVPVVEDKIIPTEKTTATVENNNPPPANGTKFLDMHFKQDSANKTNDLITPVFKEDKSKQKTIQPEGTPENQQTNKQLANGNIATEKATPIANSNCRNEANDKDFYALRKKMVAQNDADNMIMTAKKSMREKCYNTVQIRNLSTLLITDADRYQFLEAAYPFASDAYNYANLSDLLKDNYYIERFKVMLKR